MATREYGTVADFVAPDIEITTEWARFAQWTPEQRALKIEQDGERLQALQHAESTGRLVARLVADMIAAQQVAARA